MRNLEGLKITEVKEEDLEKQGMKVSEADNFEDCALTEKDKLKKLKEELLEIKYYEECVKENSLTSEEETYEDCRKM